MKSKSLNRHRGKAVLATTPKLLHWHATRAGLSAQTADALWQQACRDAVLANEFGTSDFYRAAIAGLIRLIEAESLRRDLASFGLRPLLRQQTRMITAGLAHTLACIHQFHVLLQQSQARREIVPRRLKLRTPMRGLPMVFHPAGFPTGISRRYK